MIFFRSSFLLWLVVPIFLGSTTTTTTALTSCRRPVHTTKSATTSSTIATTTTTTELAAAAASSSFGSSRSRTRFSSARRRRYRDEEDAAGEFDHDELSNRQRAVDRPTVKQTQLIGPPIMPSKPKIVVLGASGRIGRLVVRQLLDMKQLDATIIACVKNYDNACKVLYDDFISASSTKSKGPRLMIVEADLVPPEELPGYLDEEELEWQERAESAAQFYNTSISSYDNRDDDGLAIVDSNEALKDAIQDCTTIISCVRTVRPTHLWSDLLARPLWRWIRHDVSSWCKDARHPYYVHFTSTRKILGIAEREQLRREAAVEMALEEEDETRDEAVVVPKIRMIRISDNCLAQNPWDLVPLLTNIFRSQVFRYHEMAERLLQSSSLIDTVILRPGDLVDEERDVNTTHVQVDPTGEVPDPAVVSREDVASLAVASALFRSPREREAKKDAQSFAQDNDNNIIINDKDEQPTQQQQFAPFHCKLGIRWVGKDMHPYPAQGRKRDGHPTAQISLQKALKTLQKKDKKARRQRLQKRRQQILSGSAAAAAARQPQSRTSFYPLRIAESLQSRRRLQRDLKPYGIVSAIPIYLVLALVARSLIGVLWSLVCTKAWAQPVIAPVERVTTMLLTFWMTNLRVVQNFVAKWLPRGLGRALAPKKYITF